MRASLKNWRIILLLLSAATGCNGVIRDGIGEKKGQGRCLNIKIEIKNDSIGDLYYTNILEKALIEEISLGRSGKDNNERKLDYPECILSINTKKTYRDSVIGSDGTVFGRNVRFYVSYDLLTEGKLLKKNSFSIFYNSNISRYQYSNKVLVEKEEKSNIKKVSKKIFFDIGSFL